MLILSYEENDSADCDNFIALSRDLGMCESEAGALVQCAINAGGT